MTQDNRCTVPWTGKIRMLLHKNLMSACCKTPLHNFDPEKGAMTQQMIQLRKDIKANVRSQQCEECWKIEDLGGPSYRTRQSRHFTKEVDWDKLDVDQPIRDIEVVFSNKCQMQCVYCSADISSMWDDYKFKTTGRRIEISKDTPRLEDLVDVSNLRSISVTGGEPLLDETCVTFIKSLPFDPDREINLMTNLSYGDATFSVLEQIIEKHKGFYVLCSLDAIGENANRKYLNWDRWKINFEKLADNLQSRLEYRYSGLMVNITVTSLSYKDVQGVIEYIVGFRKRGYKKIIFKINVVALNSIASLASIKPDMNHAVKLSDEDSAYLSEYETNMIVAFNRLLESVQFDEELSEKTRKHLEEYFSI